MTPADIAHLQLPRDLPRLRDAITAAAAAAAASKGAEGGEDLSVLLGALAQHHPLALADLVVGARAVGGAAMARAVRPSLDTLEGVLSPAALYRRLLQLSEEARLEVLLEGARRHPTAAWLVPLSLSVEPEQAGMTHLLQVPAESLAAMCAHYAEAGCVAGLSEVGARRRSLLPARALLDQGDLLGAARAALALLAAAPEVPVIEALAAAWGPDLAPWLEALIDASAGNLDDLVRVAPYTAGYPTLEARRRRHEGLLLPPPEDGRG